MNGICPICHRKESLVDHHWWIDKTETIGHIRKICRQCNSYLRTMNSHHILPEWDKQVEYVRKNCKRATLPLRLKPKTKAKLQHIKRNNPARSWDDIVEPIIKDVDINKSAPIIPPRVRSHTQSLLRMSTKGFVD